jgi:DNA-binding XRE family transcriptional regulator
MWSSRLTTPNRRDHGKYQTIGYLERGEYSPSLHLALRIAEYFGVAVEVVFSTSPFPRIGERSA